MDYNRVCRRIRITCKRILEFIVELFTGIIPDFFRYNFYVKTSKNLKICGIVVTAIFETFVIVSLNKFLDLETTAKWWLLACALVIPLILGLSIAYSIRTKSALVHKIYTFTLMALIPIVTITMTECLNKIFIYNMTYLGFIANYILVLLMYFIVYAFSGSMRISMLVNSSILYGFALAHAYVSDFRGTPFIPMDFLSITTAVGVANTYDYSFTPTMIIATEIFVFLIVLGIKTNAPSFKAITKIITTATQPPATIAEIIAFVAAIIAFIVAIVAFIVTLTAFIVNCSVLLAIIIALLLALTLCFATFALFLATCSDVFIPFLVSLAPFFAYLILF